MDIIAQEVNQLNEINSAIFNQQEKMKKLQEVRYRNENF